MLKWLALIFMTIDHIGYYFDKYISAEIYLLLRIIGRLAFPVFALYIVKGFSRTSNRFRYLLRMFIWAVISHFAISSSYVYSGISDSVFGLEWTNILVLFFFSIMMLMGYDLAMNSYHDMIASMTLISSPPGCFKNTRYDVKVNPGGISLSPNVGIATGIFAIITSFWSVHMLNADYGFYGLLTVLFIYISYNREDQTICIANLAIMMAILNLSHILMAVISDSSPDLAIIQSFSILSLVFFKKFEKDKRKPGIIGKYFFYVYYPLHIALFAILSQNINKIVNFINRF